MKKYCDIGKHECEVLFHARTKDRPSACGIHAPRTPIKKIKVGDEFKETKVSYEDFTGVPFHKEFRITNISPSKPTSKPVATSRNKRTDSLPALLELTVIVFHKWIKKRDSHDNHFYCISCNHLLPIIAAQAGHFRPGTISSLKFNEFNVNLECVQCNCHSQNHLIGYRKNLINKIGLAKVEELEAVPFGENYKWNREELQAIINKYK
jgi:hypothetical protein